MNLWGIGLGLTVASGVGYYVYRRSSDVFAEAALGLDEFDVNDEGYDGGSDDSGGFGDSINDMPQEQFPLVVSSGLADGFNRNGIEANVNTLFSLGPGVAKEPNQVAFSDIAGPSVNTPITLRAELLDPLGGGDGLGQFGQNAPSPDKGPSPKQVAAQGLIQTFGVDDIERVADLFVIKAEGRRSQKEKKSSGPPPDIEPMLRDIANRMVWGTPAHGQNYLMQMAGELEKIGGKTTDDWAPNTGFFPSSNNEYTVPRKTKDEWYRLLKPYRPADFAIEMAVLKYANLIFQGVQKDGDIKPEELLEGGVKLSLKYGANAASGPAGWAQAIIDFLKDFFTALDKAAKRPPLVHNRQDQIVDAIVALASEYGLKFPFVELELYMVTGQNYRLPGKYSTGGYRAFPKHLAVWCQQACHGPAFATIYEGVYPGPALAAHYTLNSNKKFACTDTPDNDVDARQWYSAPTK